MSKMTLTAEIKREFEQLHEATDLVDECGQVIGRFVPKADIDRMTQPASDEEVRRRLDANEKRYSTAEVLRHLENL